MHKSSAASVGTGASSAKGRPPIGDDVGANSDGRNRTSESEDARARLRPLRGVSLDMAALCVEKNPEMVGEGCSRSRRQVTEKPGIAGLSRAGPASDALPKMSALYITSVTLQVQFVNESCLFGPLIERKLPY